MPSRVLVASELFGIDSGSSEVIGELQEIREQEVGYVLLDLRSLIFVVV